VIEIVAIKRHELQVALGLSLDIIEFSKSEFEVLKE